MFYEQHATISQRKMFAVSFSVLAIKRSEYCVAATSIKLQLK